MNSTRRTIGLDVHPDLFTAAILLGQDAATARIEKVFDKVPISQLESWAKKRALPSDDLIIEASGNTFHVAERLKARRSNGRLKCARVFALFSTSTESG